MFGVGTGIGQAAILNVNDAIFAPLVTRQQLRARQADRQTASNDTLVAVSDAYFSVQQARGELAGASRPPAAPRNLVGAPGSWPRSSSRSWNCSGQRPSWAGASKSNCSPASAGR